MKTRSLIALFAILCVSGGLLFSAGQTNATGQALSERFSVDSTHSTALFRVQHFGAGQFWGRFNDLSGTIDFNEETDDGLSLDVTIQIASVDTNNDRLDGHLKSPDFFNVREYPTMNFKSRSAKKTAEGVYAVTGDLTMHGVTREMVAEVEHMGTGTMRGKRIGFEARFTVQRSDFEIMYGVQNGMLGDETKVVIGLEAVASGN